jgi:hypothetical protein
VTEAPAEIPAGLVPGTWHESHAEITAGALAQLRVAGHDMDAERIAGKVPQACRDIDTHLELRPLEGRVQYRSGGIPVVTYAPGDAPATIVEAAVTLTVELYRRKDAAFGVLDAWSQTGEAVRIGADHLRGVASLLLPYREGWGIA